jgi:ribosomal protein S18 acetylase RimI-like enzyme
LARESPSARHLDTGVERLHDPGVALAVYLRHPSIHPYGIADVVQLWDEARWWRRGDAMVGVMDLPGSALPVIYGIAAEDTTGTVALFETLEHRGELPDRFVMTGPVGVSAALAGHRRIVWLRDYEKLAFPPDHPLPAGDPRVRVLDRTDLAALETLFATDPAAGDFFHPGLLDTGHYLGVDSAADSGPAGGRLVAAAGVHVVEPGHGVAAIGNVVTDPACRGRGLATAVVSALTHRLRAQVATVGLNVTLANVAARRLYRRIGFVPVLDYEEAELERH